MAPEGIVERLAAMDGARQAEVLCSLRTGTLDALELTFYRAHTDIELKPHVTLPWARRTGDAAIALLPAFLMLKAGAAVAAGTVAVAEGRPTVASVLAVVGGGDIGVLVMMWRRRDAAGRASDATIGTGE